MGAYKDKGGHWYVSVRYKNCLGEPSRKTKRGFTSKRDALTWEREFLQKYSGSLDMTFNSFYEVYRNDLQNRIPQNTWVTKSSIIEKKILPYFGDKRVRDVKPVDVLRWQNVIVETTDEDGIGALFSMPCYILIVSLFLLFGKPKQKNGSSLTSSIICG